MKKQAVLFFLPFLAVSAFGLSSCGEDVHEVPVTFGRLFDPTLKDEAIFDVIAYSDLSTRLGNKENIVVVVYNKNSTCACWHSFRDDFLRPYISGRNLRVFAIDYREFDGKDYLGLNVKTDTEDVAVFENGVLAYQQLDTAETEFSTDYEVFKEWMDARIRPATMVYVTEVQMDALYAGTTPFLIYFGRGTCGDCKYVDENFLKQYYDETANTQISYVLETAVEGIYYYNNVKPDATAAVGSDGYNAYVQWCDFKDKYGMSARYDADYGYNTGYVPTFEYINPDGAGTTNNADSANQVIESADVYFNDTLSAVNADGTYTVSDSFFTDERVGKLAYLENFTGTRVLKGHAVQAADGKGGSWSRTAAAVCHDPLLKAFLDYYVGQAH